MEDIIIDINTLKNYLEKLDSLTLYKKYLKVLGKKDNLTSIKNFFNNYIFISIKDFHEEKYDKLWTTNKELSIYIKKNPERKEYKNIVKEEKQYRIFLRRL
jgi:hypothetical protein